MARELKGIEKGEDRFVSNNFLLSDGQSINVSIDKTPLGYAIYYDRHHIAKYLISIGADVNEQVLTDLNLSFLL